MIMRQAEAFFPRAGEATGEPLLFKGADLRRADIKRA